MMYSAQQNILNAATNLVTNSPANPDVPNPNDNGFNIVNSTSNPPTSNPSISGTNAGSQ